MVQVHSAQQVGSYHDLQVPQHPAWLHSSKEHSVIRSLLRISPSQPHLARKPANCTLVLGQPEGSPVYSNNKHKA